MARFITLIFIALAVFRSVLASSLPAASFPCNASTTLGFYSPTCDLTGNLLPPNGRTLQSFMDTSVSYYAASPLNLPDSHGFPPFVWATFTDGDYIPTSFDIIAGMLDGMGIIGYLKYASRALAGRGGNSTAALTAAVQLGQYLGRWAKTPPTGVWANVTRSTGLNVEWPLTTAAQTDLLFGVNTIEPDKVALAGYALLLLFNATRDPEFLAYALHHARVLAATQTPGNATSAPWPFRVDSVTGARVNGGKSGDTVFALRLFRSLEGSGYPEFAPAAAALWTWVRDVQLPTADPALNASASHFVNFFEDKDATNDDNRWGDCVPACRAQSSRHEMLFITLCPCSETHGRRWSWRAT